MMFVAAGFARTIPYHNHLSEFFRTHLRKYDQLAAQFENASQEEIDQWESLTATNARSPVNITLGEEDIRVLALKPVPHLLPVFIEVITKQLLHMNMTIFTTDNPVGFITSDSPVGMYDLRSQMLPPPWNSPALGSKTIEVVMPISPEQCVFYTRGIFAAGYKKATKRFLDEFNRRHRFSCEGNFIIKANFVSEIWFSNDCIYP